MLVDLDIMIRSVVALFLVLAVSTQSCVVNAAKLKSDLQYAVKFTKWLGNWNLTYTNDVLDHRFMTFKNNYDFIEEHNERFEQGLETFQVALNEHADLTSEEYKLRLGLKPSMKQQQQQQRLLQESNSSVETNTTDFGAAAAPKLGSIVDIFGWICKIHSIPVLCNDDLPALKMTPQIEAHPQLALRGAIPDRVDWRQKGVISPIKDQGSCGSCWSFAGVSSMEAAWAQKSGRLIMFSEQEQLDCAANGARDCETGGLPSDAYEWAISHPPMPDFRYQYTGTDRSTCKYRASGATDARFKDFVNIPSGSEIALQAASASVPSISVAIDASRPSFQFYSSGVYTDSSCGNNEESLNHAVSVVGYGTDSLTGQDYWLVRNSWGRSWGDMGYIRMRRNNDNMCGISLWAQYITTA